MGLLRSELRFVTFEYFFYYASNVSKVVINVAFMLKLNKDVKVKITLHQIFRVNNINASGCLVMLLNAPHMLFCASVCLKVLLYAPHTVTFVCYLLT